MVIRTALTILLSSVASLLPFSASAQESSANDLAKQVVTHEIQAQDEDHTHWEYRLQTVKSGKQETKEVIETKDGNLEKLIAVNGQPLKQEQKQAEEQRIQKLLTNPSEQQKLQQARRDDAKKTKQLFTMIPQAFVFNKVVQEGDTVTLLFQPNPNFHPRSRESRVLHALYGELIVNTKENRLVEINGHLLHEVKFGGGILGHMDPGGRFDVKEAEVAPNHWELTSLDIEMKGKALFFKTIGVQQKEIHSQFHSVDNNLTLAQADELLKKQAPQSRP